VIIALGCHYAELLAPTLPRAMKRADHDLILLKL
jgi:hypothetical protein